MEQVIDILLKINIPTNNLGSDLIQEVLSMAKKYSQSSETDTIFWEKVAQILWQHLHSEFEKFDDQLLCATCFYTVLCLTDMQECYLNKVLHIISEELHFKENGNKESPKTLQAVSLMYGLYQSPFLTQEIIVNSNLTVVLHSIFNLLLMMAYEYSRFSFIVFKTINSFKKICGTDMQEIIFSRNHQIKLLNVVNHNWENPITGIRDINKDIFRTLVSVLDANVYETILCEINSFYWNKSKYLMLSVLIEHCNKEMVIIMFENNWTDGLLNSLGKPGLVSAGADMYYAVLKKLRSQEDWCKIFLNDIMKILNGSTNKAIENFSNYWCLTTFKKYPQLINIFISEFENFKDSEQKLYSSLCIIKQANKLGFVSKHWNSPADYKDAEKAVLKGLEHCNSHIRILAFDIICVLQGKLMPNKMEYELVWKFIHDNINSDCTVLRLNMLNSFNCFMVQIYKSYTHYYLKNFEGCDIENLQQFCEKIQDLIISCLDWNGNYQRKITSIKVAKIFLQSVVESPRKRHKQARNLKKGNVTNLFKEKFTWKLLKEKFAMKLVSLLNDPAEDIRENVIDLLLCHYHMEIRRTYFMNHLIESALKNRKSKYFYEISCGQSMFKLLSTLLVKENHPEAMFQNVENIFWYAYNELNSEYKSKRSIVESIECGKQLHSFISILEVVLEVCHQDSYIIVVPNENLWDLLEILESISNQFALDDKSSTSSDFSKISKMVENIIEKSGHCLSNEHDDYTKTSGVHQIVLNCLWLNVKASCDLLSLLVRHEKANAPTDTCEKCLNIITHVLETCRHKGAIEAAGAALGQAIRYLTSLPSVSNISKLPYLLLERKLNELITEADKMASVTRRGAGLSIMVHRIVSNDTKKGKPLFHYFMVTLLKTCATTTNECVNNDNEKDLPKAIYIHFLTRIVIDSSLASDMMYYSAELAELAFDNLTSPQWQIRNAALQLYGALIPKLIGQKKAAGVDDETVATVGSDELRTHSAKLWKYVHNQLKNVKYTDKVQYHSNLIPILNMLANIARRYNFSYDMLQQKDVDDDLLIGLMSLFDSPIYTVRRLTAKCIVNIYSFERIHETLLKHVVSSENFLHGILILLTHCYKLYNDLYRDHFSALKSKLKSIFNCGDHSYLCKVLYEDTFCNSIDIGCLNETFIQAENNSHAPGISLWVNKRVQKCFSNSSWDMFPQILKMILGRKNLEYYCKILLLNLKEDPNIPTEVLIKITNILMSFENKFNNSVIWEIIYHISLKVNLSKHIDTKDIVEYIEEGQQGSYKLRYIIPFLARICKSSGKENQLSTISNIIYDLTNSGTSDVDMRYVAAMANNELSSEFRQLPDSIKITAIKSAIQLLQDEDEDVRNLSVLFYRNLNDLTVSVQPYICLFKILDPRFLCTVMSQFAVQELCKNLDFFLSHYCTCNKTDDYNPFANDSKNQYLEIDVLKHLIENLNNKIQI